MNIITNYLSFRTGEQKPRLSKKESAKTELLKNLNPSFSATESNYGSNAGSHIRSRLKAYMEEIKNLQQQLSKLQEHEISLKKMQEKLLRIQENMDTFKEAGNNETPLESDSENISKALLHLKEAQEEVRSQIAEKLTAQENIVANLTVIREKGFAESIIKKIKNTISPRAELSVLNQGQLQQINIQDLLK